jgi:hypothetical protein
MRALSALVVAATVVVAVGVPRIAARQHGPAIQGPPPPLVTAESCIACHTGIASPRGEDVGFVSSWRASMMANASRDPYWQAGVRREVTDHPAASSAIQHECSACHMPMARYLARHAGGHGEVFANLPPGGSTAPHAELAADGVSCSLCHQIMREGLGTRESFTANFLLAPTPPAGQFPRVLGPFEADKGRMRLMRSASGFEPVKADHLAESEVCASCHTLFTASLGPNGEVVGELPEQMPYLEWRHSTYRTTRSCQSCHMPEVAGQVPVTPVLGDPRANVSQHTFLGGNVLMQRLLARNRGDLGVVAGLDELDAAARRTTEHLQSESASSSRGSGRLAGGRMAVDVTVSNHAGHKLPTAYPSRRTWLHVVVRAASGGVVFESGRVGPDGRIVGNDNDEDPRKYEPHHLEISGPDQVQVYEVIMGDPKGDVTTGLLTGVRYLKDNRLLPAGFDKASASKDVAVWGRAAEDPSFQAGGDRVRYVVDVSKAEGPFSVDVELCYQSIAYRWAKNLATYQAPEPQRFLGYYDAMARGSAVVLTRATAAIH